MAAPARETSNQRFRLIVRLALLALLLVAAHLVGQWIIDEMGARLHPSSEPMLHRVIMTAAVLYIVLLALPFVPGVEIGLSMMVMFGPGIVPLVYGCTVLGLLLGFLIGRLFSPRRIADALRMLRLKRARELVLRLETLGPQERLDFLMARAPGRFLPFLLKHRYVALAVVLNVPGNALIGGGGGISMIAGFSRLFSITRFALVVSLAVAPVPLAVLMSGG